MTKPQMELLRNYVRDQGGGLVMLGGEESFGVGGYYHTAIEEALPVTMEARQKVEIPSLAVVLVIDRSGSMETSVDSRFSKLDLAKEAAQLVVELLDERNEVGVIAFDTAWSWVVPMGPAKDKDRILKEIATIKAGGGTDLFPPLKEAYQAIFDRTALLRHVLVLSDGEVTVADFAGLVRRMQKDKISVSSVAIGKDSDVRFMTDLSRWGRGRFYYTEDIYSIPRILTLETQLASKASIIEQPFRPVLTQPGHEIADIRWTRPHPGRIRLHHAQADGRHASHLPPAGPHPGGLAVWSGSNGGLHLRRQGQVGDPLGEVGRFRQALRPTGAVDAQDSPEERGGRLGPPARRARRDPA
jgi:hypothetical protein